MRVTGSGHALGATIEGLDLARPLTDEAFDLILDALGRYSVIRFPRQELSGRDLANFSSRFGKLETNVASTHYQEPGVPEVMVLSSARSTALSPTTVPTSIGSSSVAR